MQQHGYDVRQVEVSNIFDLEYDDMYLCAVTNQHCIGVWRREIYESSHSQVMNLTKANLNWCCGYEDFTYVRKAYTIKPSKKLFIQLQKRLKSTKGK